MPGPSLEIRPCRPAERGEALHVLYRRMPAALRPDLVAGALDEAARGGIDLSGLWVAWRGGRIVGALLAQHLAGHAAAVWAPEVVPSWRRGAVAEALIRAALDDLRGQGIRVAQALIDATSPRQGAADLARGGLPRVTDLTYLGRDTARSLAVAPTVPRLDWRPFGPATEGEFRAVLTRTYLGSLDMPELEGVRSLDDVLAGHRAGGRFDPDRWQVGRLAGEPEAAAILLLTEAPDRDAWELSYLGLTPEARGRGLGRAALARALALARPHVSRLELAVDARNHPAERLYQATGFLPFDRRAVHLAILGGGR
jgi:mycothiol synthase